MILNCNPSCPFSYTGGRCRTATRHSYYVALLPVGIWTGETFYWLGYPSNWSSGHEFSFVVDCCQSLGHCFAFLPKLFAHTHGSCLGTNTHHSAWANASFGGGVGEGSPAPAVAFQLFTMMAASKFLPALVPVALIFCGIPLHALMQVSGCLSFFRASLLLLVHDAFSFLCSACQVVGVFCCF